MLNIEHSIFYILYCEVHTYLDPHNIFCVSQSIGIHTFQINILYELNEQTKLLKENEAFGGCKKTKDGCKATAADRGVGRLIIHYA